MINISKLIFGYYLLFKRFFLNSDDLRYATFRETSSESAFLYTSIART